MKLTGCVKTTIIKNSKEDFTLWKSQPTYQKDQISLLLQKRSKVKDYFSILCNMGYP